MLLSAVKLMVLPNHSHMEFVKEGHYAAIMDDTANINEEKMSIGSRIVQKNFETQVPLCEFFNTACTRAATFSGILQDNLSCFRLTIDNYRGNDIMV